MTRVVVVNHKSQTTMFYCPTWLVLWNVVYTVNKFAYSKHHFNCPVVCETESCEFRENNTHRNKS